MANEAVIIERNMFSSPIRFTVADGTGIEKGAILKLSDPRTAAAADGDSDIVAGIAASEKVASDGSTSLGVHVPGQNNIFDLKVAPGGAVAVGQLVSTSGANLIDAAAATDNENGMVLGKALEAGASAEVIAVLV